MKIAISGASLFCAKKFHRHHALLIEGTKIIGIVPADAIPSDYTAHIVNGGTIAPGFIDLQVNGGGGLMFNTTPTVNGLKTITDAHLKFGTTSVLPTVISDSKDIVQQCCDAVELALSSNPSVLGIHLEGPFFNTARRGAHAKEFIRKPTEEDIEFLCSLNKFPVAITLAPENVHADDIKRIVNAGAKVLAGHSNATTAELTPAIQSGLSGFTHLYNAMSSPSAREPAMVGTALTHNTCTASIIVDGHHVHADMVKLAYQMKPKGKLIFVSDSMATINAENKFTLYGEIIEEKEGRLVNADNVLAGSAITLIDAIRIANTQMHIPLDECLAMASCYPAQYLGVADTLGKFDSGYTANIVHFNDDFNVENTWVSGVHQTES